MTETHTLHNESNFMMLHPIVVNPPAPDFTAITSAARRPDAVQFDGDESPVAQTLSGLEASQEASNGRVATWLQDLGTRRVSTADLLTMQAYFADQEFKAQTISRVAGDVKKMVDTLTQRS